MSPRLPNDSSKDGFLLDEFSQADLRRWNSLSDSFDEYHIRLFYHLEGLRAHRKKVLLDALRKSSTANRSGNSWFRLVAFRYSNEFLSAAGSLYRGGRFNMGRDIDSGEFPIFPALYIAENFTTAYAEYFGVSKRAPVKGFSGEEFGLRKESSFTAVKLSFHLYNVFDLSRTKNLEPFSKIISTFQIPQELKSIGRSVRIGPPWVVQGAADLKKSLLAPNWRYYPTQYGIPANPQIFGRLLRDAGFEAVIYPSSVGSDKSIAIFPENFDHSDSYVELMDDAPASVLHRKLNRSNWKLLSGL
jgi:hypothetical protein